MYCSLCFEGQCKSEKTSRYNIHRFLNDSVISFVVMYIYVFSYEDSDLKSMLIVIIRVFLIYLCLFTDASVTTLWNWKIRSVLSQLRNFDRATKFRDFSKGNKLRIICHVTVFVSFSYWAIVGYFTYR